MEQFILKLKELEQQIMKSIKAVVPLEMSEEDEEQFQNAAKFCSIRSHKHQISTVEIQKVGLCCYDNKRYLLDDGITSYDSPTG